MGAAAAGDTTVAGAAATLTAPTIPAPRAAPARRASRRRGDGLATTAAALPGAGDRTGPPVLVNKATGAAMPVTFSASVSLLVDLKVGVKGAWDGDTVAAN
jgi:hypothetical protein